MSSLKLYKWILFDLDNTLMDFHEASRLSLKSLLEQNGKNYTSEIYEFYHQSNLKVWKAFEQNEIDAATLRYLRFELFLSGMSWEFNAVDWGKSYLAGIVKFSKLFAQANEILRYTKKKYKVALVTNGLREVQRPRLKKCGIYEMFDQIVVSDEIGYSKPDIEFFDYIFKQVGPHKRDEFLIVGDSLSSDMAGGKNAGIDTCWIDNENMMAKLEIKPEVNYHITELNELFRII